ncbi:MAG: NADPH-dependent assimilatory sulfite reductase hemoprotein subunit [Planctomycetota bacterium]
MVMGNDPQHQVNGPPSSIEKIKAESNYLRGQIAKELSQPTDHFTTETAQLLKLHGMYQQDDRDRRVLLGDLGAKKQKTYQFMVRTGVPGGRLTSQQLLAHIELADRYGNGTLRITSRQDLQMHGLAKQNLRVVLKRIHEVGLTTMATCGDVHRNVVCCPAPYRSDPVRGQIQWMAGQIAEALSPRTPAYREIWLDDLPAACSQESEHEIEPLYGKTYLPRKFKVGIGLPGDNCADVHCQDVGLLAVSRNYDVIGYNVLVGGGMGMTPAKQSTFPVLAQRMAYARADQILDLLRAIVRVFRDFGNRSDRKQARLKYLVADWGIERFKQQVEQYLGYELPSPEPDEVWDIDDHLGWREQGDGRFFYGLHVPSGRVQDAGDLRLKSALRDICDGHSPAICLTPGQSLLLGDVYWEDRLNIEDHLRHCGLRLVGEITNVRRWSSACVSLPSCPLALTESERALPNIIQELEGEVARLGLQQEVFALRMTGCTNGCSRPYNADIGIVGRAAGRYAIYLGGRRIGDRLSFLYRDGVPLEQLVATLVAVLGYFKQHHKEGETLGDFCHRVGCKEITAALLG